MEEVEQERCRRGKTSGEDHKICATVHSNGRMFHLQWSSPSQGLPKRDKLLALVTTEDKGESDLETPPRVNPLQLLNVLHGETPI